MDVGAAGAFSANGKVTAHGHGQVVYNQGTGGLYWDADGVGGAAKLLVGTLAAHPVLAAADIAIVH